MLDLSEDYKGQYACLRLSIYLHFLRFFSSVLRQLERSPESGYIYDRFRIALRDYLQLLLEHSSERPNSSSSRSAKDIVAQQRQRGWHTPMFILIEYAYGPKSLSEEHHRNRMLRDARDAAAEAITYALVYHSPLSSSQETGYTFFSRISMLVQERSVRIRFRASALITSSSFSHKNRACPSYPP